MNKKDEFIDLIKYLEPVEFIGLARVLCIDIMDKETKQNRDFYVVLNDMINKFNSLGRKQRREILSVLKKARKENAGTKN